MQKSIEDYNLVLPTIIKPELSIDRLTVLIYSPGFSCYEADENYRDAHGMRTRDKINAFHKAIEKIFKGSKIETEKIQYSVQTKLYLGCFAPVQWRGSCRYWCLCRVGNH